MGVVYLALAQGPGGFAKLKVLKRLRPDLLEEPGAVQMFLEEGRLSARLHHPNVVQTNEVGFDGKHYFLEMEYLEGQSLSALTRRADRVGMPGFPLALAVYALAQTLAGLHYAHELTDHDGSPLSVVHRDVSPHNVFVTYDGQVKVLDFGIAKAAGSASETKTGFIKGKVTYMAPEQVARKAVDRRADVFAVGVMLWEALAGRRLWGDLDDFEIFLKLRSEDIPSQKSARADVPDVLEAICMRALARDPESRFPTAAAMQSALEEWLDASGNRVGSKELATQMERLFGEDRVATKTEIEQQIRATPATESLVGVPMLHARADVIGAAATGSGAGTSSTLGGGTRVRQQRQIKGLRKVVMASLGVALVASVVAGALTVRNRRARNAAAAIAGASSASSAGLGGGCVKNAECGKGEICRKEQHRCVALATDRCTVLAEPGDAEDDRTIWVGAMFPNSGPEAALFGIPNTHAVDLARRDFVEATRGIPSHAADGPPRPLAIVACDDVQDPKTSARHLVDDVGVAAVIGFKSGSEAIELSRDVFIPSRVFVAAVNSSAQVTQVPQPRDEPRLVWRTSPASTLNAVPAARVVSDLLEPRLRKSGVVTDARPLRVVFARPKSQYGLSMAEAIGKALSFNGRSALANGDKFTQLVYDDPYSSDAHPDYAAVVDQLVALAPHVVIYADQEQLVDNVFAPVERGWRASGYRPYWVGVTDLAGKEILAFLGKDADRRRRFLGVSAPETTPANVQLAMHYSSEVEKITVNDTPAAAYDAAYLVAYAAYAAGDVPLTGSALGKAVARLIPPGEPIDVGPTHIFEAIDVLRRGGNVDLGGANTRLDFDVATGETAVDWVIQCAGIDTRGFASDVIESGVTFDATTGRLRGNLRCP